MNCSNCGNEISVGAKFCPACGKRPSAFCYKCGTPLSGGAQFCKSCGTKIDMSVKKVSRQRKPKNMRVSKIYSFLMLGIAALITLFTPAVQLSGEYYNTTYNTDVYADEGDFALLVERAYGSAGISITLESLVVLAMVCIGILLVSAALHSVNRWWAPLIPAGVFGVLLIISDCVAWSISSGRARAAHLGIGFLVHLLCIGLLISSFFINRYRTQKRRKVPVGHYKISRLEIGAIVTFSVFFLFAFIVTITCYAGDYPEETFVGTPMPEFQNDKEMVGNEAEFQCSLHDVDLTGYVLYDIKDDENGRYIAVYTSESASEVYAICIDSPDYYTGKYRYDSTEPVKMAYSVSRAVDKAKPSKWRKKNELYEEITNSHRLMQKGSVVPYISNYQYQEEEEEEDEYSFESDAATEFSDIAETPTPTVEPEITPEPVEEDVDDEPEEKMDEADSFYILPSSDREKVTKKDLKSLTKEQCRIARNEIYARHGRRFKDKKLQKYFDKQSWYIGSLEPDEFDESVLSPIEKANATFILKYENKLK